MHPRYARRVRLKCARLAFGRIESCLGRTQGRVQGAHEGLAEQEKMRRNMKAANEMESIRVMQGEYLDIFRTREKTGDIYMQTMPSDRARSSQAQDRFLISCWT